MSIELRDVYKAFGPNEVLRGFSVVAEEGENLVILGQSGSGKSVALKHIVGLLVPDRGEVWVDGQDVTGMPREELYALRRRVGYVFQFAALFDSMTVAENLLLGLRRHGLDAEELARRVQESLRLVDLEGAETLNPWDLPPGEIQPTKDKIAFLKNLTRHMIGDLGQTDTSLLDNILTEAIAKVYKRVAVRATNKTPTYTDLKHELSTWNDEERIEHIRGLAHDAGVRGFSIAPLLLVVVASFSVWRYVARGVGDQDGVIIAGIGSVVFSVIWLFTRRFG